MESGTAVVKLTIKDHTVLALARDLRGEAEGPVTPDVIGGLLLELQRRRAAEREGQAGQPSTLEAAADLIVSILQPGHQDQVRDAAFELAWPKWVLLAGAVARACDNQELRAGEFSPDWLNSPELVRPARELPRCQRCGVEMPWGRRGQMSCCNRHGCGYDEHSADCPVLTRLSEATRA
jgi:hypothetical protein